MKRDQLIDLLEYSSILCAIVIKKQQVAVPEHKEGQRSWRFPFVHFQQWYYGFSIVIYMKLEAKRGFQATKKQPKYAPGE